ncbi:transporter [Pseudomonas sp. NBRC 111121]|uniref:transporter n=1 Tax=Pseudomonas sp. NBRC 111121 TaxID=1661036 RepID=UPI000AAC6541|nr:transporter [Pseudomonas sp. NBRC 111121]
MKSYVARAGLVGAIGCSLLVSWDVNATENGDTVWPLGVQTVLPAILPAPGDTSLYSYTAYYKADSFKDKHGDSAIPGFSLENFIQAVRVVHTWDAKFDSGITLSSGVIASANKIKVEAFGNSDTDSGFRQLYLTPLYIGYSPSEICTCLRASVLLSHLGTTMEANWQTAQPVMRATLRSSI